MDDMMPVTAVAGLSLRYPLTAGRSEREESEMPDTMIDADASLEVIRDRVSRCEACCLHETRTLPVFGSGNPNANVMIVGEAPGRNEDETGEPFVGKAGERLNEVLALAGLSRDEVFIANVLKCRPPKNRNPKPDEIAACSGFLIGQIGQIRPEVIVTFGNFATQFVLGTKQGVSELHGQLFRNIRIGDGDGERPTVSVYPVFHPAATIYRPQWRPVLEDDMRRLGELLESGGRTDGGSRAD